MATAPKTKPGTGVATRNNTGVATWQQRLAGMAKEAVEQESSVSSGQFIGLKSGQITWNGQPAAGNKIRAIVVDSILENAYYPGKFDPDDPQPPVCFAFGRKEEDMKPHEDSLEPQAGTCDECPMNKFQTADNGKGKACKNIRRLGLIAATPLTEEAVAKGEVAFMKTPVTSVKGWAAYVRTVEALNHLPPAGVVTEIGCVPDAKTQFKVTFNYVSNVPDELMTAVLDRHDEVAKSIDFPYSPPRSEPPAPAKGAKGGARGGKKY